MPSISWSRPVAALNGRAPGVPGSGLPRRLLRHPATLRRNARRPPGVELTIDWLSALSLAQLGAFELRQIPCASGRHDPFPPEPPFKLREPQIGAAFGTTSAPYVG